MPTNVTCPNPNCGKSYSISTEFLGRRGRCKSCGTEFVFATTNSGIGNSGSVSAASAAGNTGSTPGTTSVGRPPTPARLGRFQILERVGIGGFGAVYRAQDPQLQRTVALKLLQSTGDEQRDRHRINRFLVEGRAGARLQHPNIVPVFDAGKDEETGEYYMAAAFITGRPLSAAIDGQPLELKHAATIVAQLARALDYAHTQGILHRDVKPDNVMLDEKDVPHLMDFGLARMEESESHLTRDGAVMGTPSYMSPEQCVGKQEALGPAADQYSLGCPLYELITGEKLFDGPVSVQIHHQINTEAPPSAKNAPIPHDLDTICLKTLAKEPERRYASCAELAADLERWLADEPIQARQLTTWERWNRWRRRNPAIAGLSLGLAAALLIGFAGVTTQWFRAEQNASTARFATAEQTKATEAAEKAERQAEIDRDAAREAAATNKRIAYSAHMNLCHQAWDEANIAFLHDLLEKYIPAPGDEDLRCFEWYYWWRQSHEYQWRIKMPPDQWPYELAFSPDTSLVAAGGINGEIRLLDVQSGKSLASLKGHSEFIHSLTFSRDGALLASGSRDGTARIWDIGTRENVKVHRSDGGQVMAVRFSPDGQTLLVAHQKVVSWNFKDDTVQTKISGIRNSGGEPVGIPVVFSPDGSLFATSEDSPTVSIWDVNQGKKIGTLTGHKERVTSIDFSANGTMLTTGSWDNTVRLWKLDSLSEVNVFNGHTNHIFDVAFCSNGKMLASASRDVTVRLWDVTAGRSIQTLKGHSIRLNTVKFSPDNQLLATGSRDHSVALWNITKSVSHNDILNHSGLVFSVAFSPDGQTLATSNGPFAHL